MRACKDNGKWCSLGELIFFSSLMLIILLTLTSLVTAITTVEITGTDGIKGVRGTDDITQVDVVSDGNVSIVRGDQDYPMSCDKNSDGEYICTHTFETSTLEAGEYVLTFKQTLPSSKVYTWPFIVDGKEPTITKLLVEPVDDKLNLSLTIYDESFTGSEKCSGIKSIDVTTEEDVFYTEKIPTEGVCVYEKSMIINPPKVSGDFVFTAVVQDYLGQTGELTFGPITVDFKGPEIQDEVITLSGDKKLETISAQPVMVPSADVHIKVKDENLSLVTGDLHLLSRDPALKDQDSSRTAKCTKESLMYDCVFEAVQINPGATEVPIKITATDFNGHEVTKNVTAHFAIQTERSEVTYFGRDAKENCFEGTCYYKGGANKLFMHITSQDVEIKPFLITVSASGLSTLGYIKMASCNDTGDYYNCYGYLPVDKSIPSGSKQTIALTTPSTDSLGSPLKGISSTTAVIDQDPPVAQTDLNFSVLCPITGEKDYLTINVTDEVSPIIRISASPEKISTENFFQNDCQRQGNIFVCELELNKFVSYAEQEDLAVTVEDLAGNEIEDLTIPIEVCEAETQVPPESLSSITSEPTQKIDKRMMTFMPVRAYLPLDFNFKNQNTEIVDLGTDSCVGTKDLAGKPYFINKHFSDQKTYQPILVVPIGGREQLADSKVVINCSIKVYEKRGVVRYTKPEVENLVVPMPTFNQELGTIDLATQSKLDDLVVEINDMQASIDNWQKYLKIIDKVCTVSKTLNNVFSTLSAVESVVYAAAVVFSEEGGSDLWNTLCTGLFKPAHKLRSTISPVGFVTKLLGGNEGGSGNQKFNIGVDSFLKLGCLTYNCGLCSQGGVLQALNIVSSSIDQMKAVDKQKELEGNKVDLDKANGKLEDLSKETSDLNKDKEDLTKELNDPKTTIKRKTDIKTRLSDIEKRKAAIKKSTKIWEGKQAAAAGSAKIVDGIISDIADKELDGTTIKPESINSEKTLTDEIATQKKIVDTTTKDINEKKGFNGDARSNFYNVKQVTRIVDSSNVPTSEDPGINFGRGEENTRYNNIKYEGRKGYRAYLKDQEKTLSEAKINLYALNKIKNYNYVDEAKSAFMDREIAIEGGGVVERLDPFENKNFAAGCLCGPGIVYAKEKLKQLTCREYDCIKENAKNGLPITSCDVDFDQGKCMYYDGPQSKIGFWNDFFTNTFKDIFWGEVGVDGYGSAFATFNKAVLTSRKVLCPEEYLPFGLGSSVYSSTLGSMSDCTITKGWRTVACGVSGAYLAVANYKSYFQNPWQPGLREIKGKDYCSDVPLGAAEE